jgi:hypothetical protein
MLTEVLAFAQCGNLATPIRSPSRGVSCERGRRAQTRGSGPRADLVQRSDLSTTVLHRYHEAIREPRPTSGSAGDHPYRHLSSSYKGRDIQAGDPAVRIRGSAFFLENRDYKFCAVGIPFSVVRVPARVGDSDGGFAAISDLNEDRIKAARIKTIRFESDPFAIRRIPWRPALKVGIKVGFRSVRGERLYRMRSCGGIEQPDVIRVLVVGAACPSDLAGKSDQVWTDLIHAGEPSPGRLVSQQWV